MTDPKVVADVEVNEVAAIALRDALIVAVRWIEASQDQSIKDAPPINIKWLKDVIDNNDTSTTMGDALMSLAEGDEQGLIAVPRAALVALQASMRQSHTLNDQIYQGQSATIRRLREDVATLGPLAEKYLIAKEAFLDREI